MVSSSQLDTGAAKERSTTMLEERGTSSSLLLRLFQSSFFNLPLAIQYLARYPNEIGITHYLVKRLESFDAKQIDFYWPQLCNLLVTRSSSSVALENYIVRKSEEDLHLAIITLWYLQSSLYDISTASTTTSASSSATPTNSIITSPQFIVCHRVFNRLQSLIFTDPPDPPVTSSLSSVSQVASTSKASSLTSYISRKVNAVGTKSARKLNSPLTALIGLSLTASAVGQPALIIGEEGVGRMLVDQARSAGGKEGAGWDEDDDDDDDDDESEEGRRSSGSASDREIRGSTKPLPSPVSPATTSATTSKRKQRIATPTAVSYLPGAPLDRTPRSSSFMRQSPVTSAASRTLSSRSSAQSSISIHQTQSSPYLPSTHAFPPSSADLSSSTRPSSIYPSPAFRPAASTPYLLLSSPTVASPSSLPDAAASLPLPFLSLLMRLQSARAQLDLFRSLNALANKLIAVPKGPAREASLRAEIMGLNHRLSSSSGCCLGMGCLGEGDYYYHVCRSKLLTNGSSATASPSISSSHQPHSRIVRISPSESVVLNSADRAPFVLHVEVLEGDLDFDPERKGNREDLKRALAERERGRGGAAAESKHTRAESVPNASLASTSSLPGRSISVQRPPRPSSTSANPSTRFSPLPTLPMPSTSQAFDKSIPSIPSLLSHAVQTSSPVEEEEMDLVEQLYGSRSRKAAVYGQPSAMLQLEEDAIHNRALDEQAWSAAGATIKRPTSTTAAASLSQPRPSSATSSTTLVLSSVPSNLSVPSSADSSGRLSSNGIASMDDYSSRMRTAAIMLTQLSAAQQLSTTTASLNTLSTLSPVSVVTGIGGVVGAGLGAGLGAIWERYGTSSAAPKALPSPPVPCPARSSTAATSAERQRVLSTVEATSIRNRIMQEMIQLEEERMARMATSTGRKFNSRRGREGGDGVREDGEGMEDQEVVRRAVNKDDPSGAVFRESFAAKTARIRASSPYGHLSNWNVISVIVKTGADLRQEQLAIQLISEFGRIWEEEKCPSYVRYFKILVTSESSGLIETITDAVSVHSIKKDAYSRATIDGGTAVTSFTLYDHYVESFGSPTLPPFRKAQDAFIKSLASYSVICYLLQLKDRHNGNILVDKAGHLIHIDFGFLLSNSPGSIGFEMAPFKFTPDYIDILGGFESDKYLEFALLFRRAFKDARRNAERIITLVELMQKDSNLPCFANGVLTSQQLRERFQLTLTESQVDDFCGKLILSSMMSNFTRLYDLFQYHSNGIL